LNQVTLTIGGRKHTVSCAAGEEDHVTRLGESIDAKFQQLGNVSVPDSQNMLFAALLLADELHEAKATVSAAMETQQNFADERDALARRVEELVDARANLPEATSLADNQDLAPALERFAELLENCADKLEAKAPTS
jgi:cell division protein ZapA